jgi:high-affinity iron transporter
MESSFIASRVSRIILGIGLLSVIVAMIWQALVAGGVPDPSAASLDANAVILNTSLIVFREGLEAILVLAAITASFIGAQAHLRKAVFQGAGWAFLASIVTWFIVTSIIDAIDAPMLHIQAATGLLAIVVLLVIMNWFFHNIYWTGWITHHNQRKRALLSSGENAILGMVLLGFSAVYREGFEIVLFLQHIRLNMGTPTVIGGVLIGLCFTLVIGAVTFLTKHKLQYKRLLIVTGLMLAMVLVVMVGEEIQEMQQAGWLATHTIDVAIPGWLGMWFAVFPNIEGLVAQFIALILVIGSYIVSRMMVWRSHQVAMRTQAS